MFIDNFLKEKLIKDYLIWLLLEGGKMVKITIELSKLEIQMLINAIEQAIDIKHAGKVERLKEIRNQFNKYL